MSIAVDYLILSTQVALLVSVIPNIRAVTIGTRTNNRLFLTYFFDGVISETDRDHTSVAACEIISDFDDDVHMDWVAERVDYPQPVPWQDMLIYHRYEPDFKLSREPFDCPKTSGKNPDRVAVRLIALRALLGVIGPEVRAVYLRWDPYPILINCFINGMISQLQQNLAHQVKAQFLRWLIDGTEETVKLQIIRCDWPEVYPRDHYAIYCREEAVPPGLE